MHHLPTQCVPRFRTALSHPLSQFLLAASTMDLDAYKAFVARGNALMAESTLVDTWFKKEIGCEAPFFYPSRLLLKSFLELYQLSEVPRIFTIRALCSGYFPCLLRPMPHSQDRLRLAYD
jgi:hypothetical protein